jgi:hypothetical protein
MTIYNKTLTIHDDILAKCDEFSLKSAPTNLSALSRRGQYNIDAIKRQIKTGKIAETLVYSEISKDYPDLTEPDFNIYTKKNKSWAPDLKDKQSNLRLAVKAQEYESSLQYHESWVFQFNGGKNYDCDKEVFGENIADNNYVAFVLLNTPKRTGQIRAIVAIKWLHDKKLFQPMALRKFNVTNNKLAVYYNHPNYNSLNNYSEELWQL